MRKGEKLRMPLRQRFAHCAPAWPVKHGAGLGGKTASPTEGGGEPAKPWASGGIRAPLRKARQRADAMTLCGIEVG
jgi:hypothetical protein